MIDVILVLNVLTALSQDYHILAGRDVRTGARFDGGLLDSVWFYRFTVLYVVEAVLKIIVNGWATYIESPRNTFDLFVTAIAVFASTNFYCK